MAEVRSQPYARSGAQVQVDQGLKSYMLGVYNYMSLGIAATALIVLASFQIPAVGAIASALYWPAFIGILALGFFGPRLIFNSSPAMAQFAYWAYVACWGFGIAPIVNRYLGIDPGMVMSAFLTAAITFGGMSVWGYTSKRDLTGMGTTAAMILFGLFVAAMVNLGVAMIWGVSSTAIGISMLISAGFVILVSLITAWETQMIKELYYAGDASEMATRKSIFGAFALYGSFVSIFINILQLMGFMSSSND
jgi:uncharacterized protein